MTDEQWAIVQDHRREAYGRGWRHGFVLAGVVAVFLAAIGRVF